MLGAMDEREWNLADAVISDLDYKLRTAAPDVEVCLGPDLYHACAQRGLVAARADSGDFYRASHPVIRIPGGAWAFAVGNPYA